MAVDVEEIVLSDAWIEANCCKLAWLRVSAGYARAVGMVDVVLRIDRFILPRYVCDAQLQLM